MKVTYSDCDGGRCVTRTIEVRSVSDDGLVDALNTTHAIVIEYVNRLEAKVEEQRQAIEALHAHSRMLEARCNFWENPLGLSDE